MATPLNQLVVHRATHTRKVAINLYVRRLAASNDKRTLDSIANILKVGATPDIFTGRNNIILEMHKRVTAKPSMDALSTLLKPVTGKDF
jgi:hypothetical protein